CRPTSCSFSRLSLLPTLSLPLSSPHSSYISFFFSLLPLSPISTLFPYTTLFRSHPGRHRGGAELAAARRTRPQNRSDQLHRHRRSEEHTSELQSRFDLVCRLLLEKKKTKLQSCSHMILRLLRRKERHKTDKREHT